ncbi:NAD-dependent epimerase/dehydratase family protein [Desulfovibrio subterraneus]|uniref:NAD-dependent epimerase/dehydratase family protein n=1 Tax=Desulfovibrio subterraneus TaxID=2718620 RepID=UPI0022B860B4|nr:NAD-dependent epimerase/dehydratase family protein [Desulfovibrio subterraneus]WBF66276.1 NAD-dependent epimerase/dehydratase family protein [Desulfovibrio subterraneus]
MVTKKKWVITGGCGFIGVTLIRQLLKKNPRAVIRVIDNLTGGDERDLAAVTQYTRIEAPSPLADNSGIELVVADIRDAKAMNLHTKGADIILHLAANTGVQPSIADPIADMQANVIGTVNILEAARANSVNCVILASSGAPIGEATPPLNEKAPCRPISPYGASKLAGEAYLSAYSGSYGLNTIALRFSNVYGPLSFKKGSVVAKFIREAFAGKPWHLNGGGLQTRDFIYSEDLAEAILRAAALSDGANLFQIASGKELAVIDMARILAAILKEKAGINVTMQASEALMGDVARNFADISHAKTKLNWSPLMDLRTGLEKTVNWFQSIQN